MDLEQAQMLSGRRWSAAKLAALICFALACGLLIGSLLMPAKAKADPGEAHSLPTVLSSTPS